MFAKDDPIPRVRGKRQQISVTGADSNHVPSQKDIGAFLDIVVSFVNFLHGGQGGPCRRMPQRRLDELCFGDMSVQVA